MDDREPLHDRLGIEDKPKPITSVPVPITIIPKELTPSKVQEVINPITLVPKVPGTKPVPLDINNNKNESKPEPGKPTETDNFYELIKDTLANRKPQQPIVVTSDNPPINLWPLAVASGFGAVIWIGYLWYIKRKGGNQ